MQFIFSVGILLLASNQAMDELMVSTAASQQKISYAGQQFKNVWLSSFPLPCCWMFARGGENWINARAKREKKTIPGIRVLDFKINCRQTKNCTIKI